MGSVVHALHRKPEVPGEHGLPKPAAEHIEVTERGVAGDFNRYRHERHADDPTSAVLLLPLETLEELQGEDWPVRPGDLGENITTRGISPAKLRPGVRLRVGTTDLEVTRPCDPCRNVFLLPYAGEKRGPEFLRALLGRRGWYAKVLKPGSIRRGDPIEVLASAT
ncbi:MAG: MOSC domain-containing protein [Thermoplasmata archaeon]|nr:MOSC domain-containing protein [Thermoplasmata archaeon]